MAERVYLALELLVRSFVRVVLRVVLRKAPKWEPASRAGKAVSFNLKMPLTFK